MEKDNKRENTKESNRKSVRSKYRTEYSGDHVFDYKDPASLTRFISDGAKITPARISKLSLAQQKKVAAALLKSAAPTPPPGAPGTVSPPRVS